MRIEMIKERLFVPVIPPGVCTDLYRAGWDYAQQWLERGGSRHSDAPPDWPEEKFNGFVDRLGK